MIEIALIGIVCELVILLLVVGHGLDEIATAIRQRETKP